MTRDWEKGRVVLETAGLLLAALALPAQAADEPYYAKRLAHILAVLDAAESLHELDLPGFRLHSLKGDLRGYWAISVSGNWRIVFTFNEGNAEPSTTWIITNDAQSASPR